MGSIAKTEKIYSSPHVINPFPTNCNPGGLREN